jgi:DNA transposition AAA+ family ATPase
VADQRTDPDQARLTDALAQDARVQLETRMLPEGRLSKEQLDAVREKIAAYLNKTGLTLKKVSKSTDYGASTLSQVMSGTYQGSFEKCLRQLYTFIEQHAAGQDAGMPTGFVSTRVAERILGVMKHAQQTRTIGIVYGPAGVSKSLCAEAAERSLIVGAVHIHCVKTCKAPGNFLELLARRMGIPHARTAFRVQMDIIDRLSGSDRLPIIDEAHYLSTDTLHIVRDIVKQAKIGCVLMGTRPEIEAKVDDFGEFYGQMTRLISARYDIHEDALNSGDPMFSVDEIIALAKSAQLKLTTDAATWLQMRANIPGWGGLGSAAAIMATAWKLAKERNLAAIGVRELKIAERAQGVAHFELAEHKLLIAREKKVAVA